MDTAKLKDLDYIFSCFQKHKDIFPYIRKDYVKRAIESKQCIFNGDIAIIYHKYVKKTKLGSVYAQRGDYILHEIVKCNKQARSIDKYFQNFIDECCKDGGALFLTVRVTNLIAIGLYTRNGMKKVGDIAWKSGELKGSVYSISKTKQEKLWTQDH